MAVVRLFESGAKFFLALGIEDGRDQQVLPIRSGGSSLSIAGTM